MQKSWILAAAAAFVLAQGAAFAAEPQTKKGAAGGATAAAAAMSEGEVRKVDKDAGKITLKHGEIKNLDMPPMTMVFQVKDPAMLSQVKQGDKVRFTAEQKGGALTITSIAPAK